MANESFQRAPGKGKFAYSGVNLHNPPDLMPQGRAPFLLNVSPDERLGAINPRAGLTEIAGVTGIPHSVRRVNNNLPGAAKAWQRFVGAGANLYTGQSSFTQIDSGFSGNPLSMVPYRPPMSPESWLYAYDSLKQAKYRTDGETAQQIGIFPPRAEPFVVLQAPNINPLLDVTGVGSFTGSGAAGAPSLLTRLSGTTIAAIAIEPGTTGWATIQPTNGAGNYSAINTGMRITVNTETATVQQVYLALPSTTVSAILYDSGSTGFCTIVPAVAFQGLERGAMVVISGTPAIVESVTQGPDGLYSFRCSLSVNVAAGATIAVPASFRVYLNNTHSVGESLTSSAVESSMTLTGGATSGTGLLSTPLVADASQINGRPVTDEDYLHVSLYIDQPLNVSELHLLFDVDAATNDFAHNYFYFVARQGDFLSNAAGQTSVISSQLNAIQNEIAGKYPVTIADVLESAQLPYPAGATAQFGVASSDQFTGGSGQWYEAIFRVSDLMRVGADETRSIANIKAFGVQAILTGNATVAVGGVWVGGTYGPDVNMNSYGNQGQPILYRYRYRSSLTGAVSDVSPATRSGVLPWRQGVSITLVTSPDPQVDLIDIERNGGTFNDWHRVLTIPNTTSAVIDTVKETVAAASDPLELLQYQPWPVTDKPRYGTCNITGTEVIWVSGDQFNGNWIRGVEFIVNNQTYTLHMPPLSSTHLSLDQSAGALTNVPFIIPEATIIGQPLPYACLGPDGRIFATGDPYNPGNLYFSNAYNPDTASDQGYIEVTGPSDPLGPPVYFEGAIYVRTATDVYRVDATPGQANPYAAYKLGGSTGQAAPWAVSVEGPVQAWLGSDGVYMMTGQGQGANLTTDDLYPLFPFESRPGLPVSVNGYTLYPPDYTQPARLRLSQANGFLFFDYVDTQGSSRTLAMNLATKGWIPYQYSPGVTLHYQEEGITNPATLALGADGSVNYLSNAANDNGTAFTCVVITPADDQGETRARKQYGDLMLDYTGTPNITVYYDNFLLSSISPVLAAAASRTQTAIDLGLDAAALHRNIGLVITFGSSGGTTLYEWQPSYLAKPEDTVDRPTDWMDAGTIGYKYVHGCRITADTGGVTRTVQIQYDGGLLGPTLSVNHNGEVTLPHSFTPFKAHLLRLVPTDTASWRLIAVEWDVDPEPEPTSVWISQPSTFDMPGYLHMRDLQLAYATPNAGAVLSMIVDGKAYTLNSNLPSTSGAEVKSYITAPPVKGKVWQLSATGTALQIYQRDCEFRIKPWGGESYATVKPFGDTTGGGARI
jgi:hypothetical protein